MVNREVPFIASVAVGIYLVTHDIIVTCSQDREVSFPCEKFSDSQAWHDYPSSCSTKNLSYVVVSL